MSVNKVIILGNLGKDPDIKTFDNGDKIANFTVATTDRGFTTKDGTVVEERTEWHNCTATRGLADVVEKYVKKGDKVYIEGKLNTRKYQDKNGEDRYVTEIRVQQLEMLTPKQGGNTKDNLQQKVQERAQNFAQNNAPQGAKQEKSDLPF